LALQASILLGLLPPIFKETILIRGMILCRKKYLYFFILFTLTSIFHMYFGFFPFFGSF